MPRVASGGRNFNQLLNYVGHAPMDGQMKESWSAPGDPVTLVAEFAGWGPLVERILAQVQTRFRWGLYDREALPRWSRGRLTLLGDAAHPMLPQAGQGATQAIEDGVALATILAQADRASAWQRSDAMRAGESDPREIIRGWSRLVTEVAPRVAPILLLIRTAAATDADMATLQNEVVNQRLERMLSNARALHERGSLRQGVSLAEARDVLWLYSSPELYELLVLIQGWSIRRFSRFSRFIADAMIAALLPVGEVDAATHRLVD